MLRCWQDLNAIMDDYRLGPPSYWKRVHRASISQISVRATRRDYFSMIQPYDHRIIIPNPCIETYSFPLYPDDAQPSGFCNRSKIVQHVIQFIGDTEPWMSRNHLVMLHLRQQRQTKLKIRDEYRFTLQEKVERSTVILSNLTTIISRYLISLYQNQLASMVADDCKSNFR